jgi:hypothetical protein
MVSDPNFLPQVHASSGSLVCLADPGFTITPNTNACPATAPTFAGPNATSVGEQLRVNVNVNNTGPWNGFDITILADHTKLRPFGVDLSHSMLPSPSISNECIGGIVVQGVCPSHVAGNPDGIQLGVGSSQFPNCFPSCFGTVFTAIYMIVGNTTGTSLSFQTGCGSLTSIPPLCVVLTSGGSVNVPVSQLQTATYSTNSAAPFTPFIKLKPTPLVLSFTQGTAGPTTNSNVTMSELNGFSCGGINCVTLTAIKPAASGLSVSLNITQLSDPPSNGVKITVTTAIFTPAGIFTLYILAAPATSPSLQPSVGTTYLGALTNITITVVGSSNFAMAANPATVITSIGTAGTSTIQVAGGKIFTGVVGLSPTISPLTGMTCSVNPTSLTSSTSPWLMTSLLSCTAATGGTYTVTVTGTYSTITHTTQVTFITPSFSLTSTPTSLTILAGQTGTTTLNVQSVNGFSGTVALSTSITPSCANCASLSPTNVNVATGGTNSSTLSVTLPQSAAGSYVVTVTGSSGPITQTVQVTVSSGSAKIVIVSVTPSPTSPVAGQTVTFTVKLNNTGTLLGNFSVWIDWGSMRVTTPINDTIGPGSTKVETLTWDTTGYAAGSDTITIVLATTGGNNGPGSQLSGQTLSLAAAPPPLFNTTTLAIIGAAAVVAAIVVVALFLRRRNRTRIV